MPSSALKQQKTTGQTGPVVFIIFLPHGIEWLGGERMNACELTTLVTAAANYLACCLTEDELNLLGVMLTQLGDTLMTIATQRSICAPKKET